MRIFIGRYTPHFPHIVTIYNSFYHARIHTHYGIMPPYYDMAAQTQRCVGNDNFKTDS